MLHTATAFGVEPYIRGKLAIDPKSSITADPPILFFTLPEEGPEDDMMDFLLEQGCSINDECNNESPWQYAIAVCYQEDESWLGTISRFPKHGGEVNTFITESIATDWSGIKTRDKIPFSITPLHAAIATGRNRGYKDREGKEWKSDNESVLRDRDPNWHDFTFGVIKELLEAGADTEVRDGEGFPVIERAGQRSAELRQFLLKHWGKVTPEDTSEEGQG